MMIVWLLTNGKMQTKILFKSHLMEGYCWTDVFLCYFHGRWFLVWLHLDVNKHLFSFPGWGCFPWNLSRSALSMVFLCPWWFWSPDSQNTASNSQLPLVLAEFHCLSLITMQQISLGATPVLKFIHVSIIQVPYILGDFLTLHFNS